MVGDCSLMAVAYERGLLRFAWFGAVHLAVQHPQGRLRLRTTCAWFESAQQVQPADFCVVNGVGSCVGAEREIDLRQATDDGAFELRRCDSCDGQRFVAKEDLLADDIGSATELPVPQSMTDHSNGLIAR